MSEIFDNIYADALQHAKALEMQIVAESHTQAATDRIIQELSSQMEEKIRALTDEELYSLRDETAEAIKKAEHAKYRVYIPSHFHQSPDLTGTITGQGNWTHLNLPVDQTEGEK